MKNVIALLMISFFCFACGGAGADVNTANSAKTVAAKATKAGPIMDPNKIGSEAFAALQTNDVEKFKSIFMRKSLRADFIKMLTAVQLTPEQEKATIAELDASLNAWGKDNGAAVENLFNNVRQQGFDKGIDWKNTAETGATNEMKQVTVFQMYVNLYDVVVKFKDQNQVNHQMRFPYNYYLESGIVVGGAVLDF